MLLKEFDLDAPCLNKSERHKFRLETRCISSLYERFFNKKLKTDKCWKVLVEGVTSVTKPCVRDQLGVFTIEVLFDFELYSKASDDEKKVQILELLQKGIIQIGELQGWDICPFNEAYQKVIDVSYINDWVWGKPIMNSSKNLKAEVYCQHGLYKFTSAIRVYNKSGGLILDKEVVNEQPDEFAFTKYFGRLKWTSQNQIMLEAKDGATVSLLTVSMDN